MIAPWAWFLIGFFVCLILAVIAAAIIMRQALARQRQRTIKAIERARRAEHLAELGSMTGGLAHEIKNPLSTLSLNAQLLTEDLTENEHLTPEERHRLVRRTDVLRREADRVKGILTDFLQFAGQLRLDCKPCDLNVLVDELADFFAPQAQNAGVRLHVTPASEPALALVDPALFKQAMLNLLLNANQAMESRSADPAAAESSAGPAAGGSSGAFAGSKPRELMIRVERYSDPMVVNDQPAQTGSASVSRGWRDREPSSPNGPQVGSTPVGQWAIHITDTGPGIAPEHLGSIFKPYYSTRKGGTGLGLPTSKRIIEEHGGTIAVHSAVGQGTDFVMILPAADK